ncbi:N-formylglutamate amidohydrolase [candidate division KSB1 bacterium]|nr:N-formylglutamate amidohydrolase [candidate division KSB1 bacterium]
MDSETPLSLLELRQRLFNNQLPVVGITPLGSSRFYISQPAFYAGVAIHAGNRVRPDIQDALAVTPHDRYREEDPYTDSFIQDFPIQIICRDSRFEYDVNRELERGIYDEHKKTWGLTVWQRPLTEKERQLSLAKHQEFHDLMDIITSYLLRQNRYAIIFDMHSYCYQRTARLPWYQDAKPEVNLGTKAVNQQLFAPVIEKFMRDLATTQIDSRRIRVLQNDVFFGGYLSRRLSAKFFDNVLVLALEFKKIFMDEWSGQLYPAILAALTDGFRRAVDQLLKDDFFHSQSL